MDLKYKGRLMVQIDKSSEQVMAWTHEKFGGEEAGADLSLQQSHFIKYV